MAGRRVSAREAAHFLRHWIYRDQTLTDLLRPAGWGILVVCLLGLAIAMPMDLARARERRHGRRRKGPELVTARRFTRRLRADGIGFVQRGHPLRPARALRIPRALESSHVLIMGDSGTGKSALIRQMLGQIETRGETAIVYDPALEYTAQFYTPARGDLSQSPDPAPYWTPEDEVRAPGGLPATSPFPTGTTITSSSPRPRAGFCAPADLKPTPEQPPHGSVTPDIDRRRADANAAMIDRRPRPSGAASASLNMVADTLKLLPAERTRACRGAGPRGRLTLAELPDQHGDAPRLVLPHQPGLDTPVLGD